MHRLLLVAALFAALAGCSVNVEGAACDAVGQAAQCPAGQLCGADRRCSAAAAACPAAPCVVGTKRCEPGQRNTRVCAAAADAICSLWSDDVLCGSEKSCSDPAGAGSPVCLCDEIFVDPTGVTPAAGSCHTATIAEAIIRADELSQVQVRLVGDVAGGPAIYSRDTAPLVIPAGFTVVGGDSPAAPGNRIVEVGAGTDEAVRVLSRGRLVGVTVRRGDSAPGVGVSVVGTSPDGIASLAAVRVDAAGAGGPFVTGVQVKGSAAAAEAVRLDSLDVRGASAEGLRVEMDGVDDVVTVAGGVLDGNAIGVNLAKGSLGLSNLVVKSSQGFGILADGSALGLISLAASDSVIHHNGQTGVFARQLSGVSLQNVRICANSATSQSIAGTTRSVGGVLLGGAAPPAAAQTFSGLRIHGNAGDQLAFGAGTLAWDLDGPSDADKCGPRRNLFAGYSAGVGLVAGAPIAARYNSWLNDPPAASDVLGLGTNGSVDAGAGPGKSDFCQVVAEAVDAVCPSP